MQKKSKEVKEEVRGKRGGGERDGGEKDGGERDGGEDIIAVLLVGHVNRPSSEDHEDHWTLAARSYLQNHLLLFYKINK